MNRKSFIILVLGLLCACLVTQVLDVSLWLEAARDLIARQNPYHVPNLINPIVVPLAFMPVAWLPDALVARLLAFCSGIIAVAVIWREKRQTIVVLLILISPIFLYSIYFVNLDWLVIAALLVSPVPAFFLALLKPQIGLGIALLAWLRVWQTNKPLAVLLIAIEVMIYGVSYALGMRWEFAFANFNRSVFPFGLIIGLPLIVIGLRQRDAVIALAAMPFLSPYVGAQSWVAVLPLLARFAPNARAPGSRPTSRFVKRFSVVDPSEFASHVHSPTQEIDDAIREYAQFTMNHGWIRRLSDKLLAGHRLTSVD